MGQSKNRGGYTCVKYLLGSRTLPALNKNSGIHFSKQLNNTETETSHFAEQKNKIGKHFKDNYLSFGLSLSI